MNVVLRGCHQQPAEELVPEHLPFTISRNGAVDMQRWTNELARGDAQVAQMNASKAAGVETDGGDGQLRRAQFHGRQLQGRTVALSPGVGASFQLPTFGFATALSSVFALPDICVRLAALWFSESPETSKSLDAT